MSEFLQLPEEWNKSKIKRICEIIAEEYKVEVDDILDQRCRKLRVNEARWMCIYAVDRILGKEVSNDEIREVIPFALDFIRWHRSGEYTSILRWKKTVNYSSMNFVIETLKEKEAV